jgi:hypothetical protein
MPLPFPNIPLVPGVPPIPRLPGSHNVLISLGVDALTSLLWQSTIAPPVWGVFDSNGNQVVNPDSVIDFESRAEWQLSSFPVQRGAFKSYNKVVVPPEYTVRMSKGGSASDRANFLAQIDAIAGDTNLYTIMTPEQSYLNCNISRRQIIRQGVSGAFFLMVDLFFVTVNQTTAQYNQLPTIALPSGLTLPSLTNAQDPTAQPAQNQGTVYPQPVDSQTATAIAQAYGA